MTDEQFHELKKQFPGEHRMSLWRYAFYFTNETTLNTFKGICLLLNHKPENMGDIGPNMLDRFYITFKRNPYANAN